MLFPIGINQSYAQTNTVTVGGPPISTGFDFTTSGNVVGAGCLTDAVLTATPTGVSGTLGGPASDIIGEACFRNDRTWQSFILNAGTDNDILDSTTPLVTSGTDMHTINFDDLDPETNYRAVLLLTGEYSGGVGANFFSDVPTYRVTTFSTPATVAPDTSAPDITIEALIGTAGTLTIPLSTLVTSPAGEAYDDLDITLLPTTVTYNFVTSATGVSNYPPGNPPNAGVPLMVNAETVVVGVAVSASSTTDFVFEYTVTGNDEITRTGMLTITFVNIIGDIVASPNISELSGLFGLPTIDIEITPIVITDILLDGIVIGAFDINDVTITTNGTGVNSAGVVDTTITGSEGGTLTVTDAVGGANPILHYTPADGFEGLEAFEYTITIDGKSASSQYSIRVPALVCQVVVASEVDFGTGDAGVTSDESAINIANDGNAANQVRISGAKWLATDATNTNDIMDEDVTRWSLSSGEYNTKTSLLLSGVGIADVGKLLNPADAGEGSVMVYLQLLITLIDDAFRGETTQVMTIASDCST